MDDPRQRTHATHGLNAHVSGTPTVPLLPVDTNPDRRIPPHQRLSRRSSPRLKDFPMATLVALPLLIKDGDLSKGSQIMRPIDEQLGDLHRLDDGLTCACETMP